MKVQFFATAPDFRKWLQKNFENKAEVWVGFYQKSSGKKSIAYLEAVDEALCFGWIDGVRKKVSPDSYTNRFTPRREKSQWSAVNIKRVQELAKLGRMHPAGMKAFQASKAQPRKYSYEQRKQVKFDRSMEEQFRENTVAWDYFNSQAPWYRRTATFWVLSSKKEETQLRRLATLIDDSSNKRFIKPLRRPVPKR